jgi:hypothetical protein
VGEWQPKLQHWAARLRGGACRSWTRSNSAFCEGRGLLPAESLEHAFEHRDPYNRPPTHYWLLIPALRFHFSAFQLFRSLPHPPTSHWV